MKPESASSDHTIYTCPMHPEVQQDKPGKCPKCGMDLVPKGRSLSLLPAEVYVGGSVARPGELP